MDVRMEHDSMGQVPVPADHLWGAQTQRSLNNFHIGQERMPNELIVALAQLKKACALANTQAGKLTQEQSAAIAAACDDICDGKYPEEFPLHVWQTGSGTQTNMNVNEVIAHIAAEHGVQLHPNDHVNCSQSSNDVFPSAIHMAALEAITQRLMPRLTKLMEALDALAGRCTGIRKIGRTHLQDAVPLDFADEVGAWRSMVAEGQEMLQRTLPSLQKLAIGGTAVGSGLNAPRGFDEAVCRLLQQHTGQPYRPDADKYHALSSKDAVVFTHGALKALACNLMKIANDVRWLASGPRCGLGEITIPANEPGSSIMPGKVNPTQCEAITMIAAQVMGNDATIGFAASQGNFQLNVFMPVIAYNLLQSIGLLADGVESFAEKCVVGIVPNPERMQQLLKNSLMLVTCLTPLIGYEAAAAIAASAYANGTTLREEAIQSGKLSAEEFDQAIAPQLGSAATE